MVTETWLEKNHNEDRYELANFTANFNSRGRGRGIAAYCDDGFKHVVNINHDGFSITKLENKNLDIIGIYRSQNGNVVDIVKELTAEIDFDKNTSEREQQKQNEVECYICQMIIPLEKH